MKHRDRTTIGNMTDHHGNPITLDLGITAGEWLDYGIARGWCSDSYCGTHDAFDALTPDELAAWDGIDDPCVFSVRLF
jgi:hypothetical protein